MEKKTKKKVREWEFIKKKFRIIYYYKNIVKYQIKRNTIINNKL